VQVFAVTSVGFAEGYSHVNWKKLAAILVWWFLGFFCVLLAMYALVAQGGSSSSCRFFQSVHFLFLWLEAWGASVSCLILFFGPFSASCSLILLAPPPKPFDRLFL